MVNVLVLIYAGHVFVLFRSFLVCHQKVSGTRILVGYRQWFLSIRKLNEHVICRRIYIGLIQFLLGQNGLFHSCHFHKRLVSLLLFKDDNSLHIPIFVENRKQNFSVDWKLDICNSDDQYIVGFIYLISIIGLYLGSVRIIELQHISFKLDFVRAHVCFRSLVILRFHA